MFQTRYRHQVAIGSGLVLYRISHISNLLLYARGDTSRRILGVGPLLLCCVANVFDRILGAVGGTLDVLLHLLLGEGTEVAAPPDGSTAGGPGGTGATEGRRGGSRGPLHANGDARRGGGRAGGGCEGGGGHCILSLTRMIWIRRSGVTKLI